MKDNSKEKFEELVIKKIKRKQFHQTQKKYSILSSIGLFGLVGWNIVVPILIGIFAGNYLDANYSHPTISWTLSGMILGVFIGSINVWYWLKKES